MDRIRDYVAFWHLEDVELLFAGVRGQVFHALRHGRPVILKIPNMDIWGPNAGKALLHFTGHGAVRLLAEHLDAVLMERVEPGAPLSSRVYDGHDDEATGVICDVASELHKAGPGEGFPSIPEWKESYDRHGRHDGSSRLSAALYTRAKGLYQELALSQGKQTLLHGDLHHDNILSDHQRGWVAIDPKGWVGEPAYEYACMLRNPGTDPRRFADAKILSRRLTIIRDRTGLDEKRLSHWAFACAVLSAIWALELGEDPARGLATARALESLL